MCIEHVGDVLNILAEIRERRCWKSKPITFVEASGEGESENVVKVKLVHSHVRATNNTQVVGPMLTNGCKLLIVHHFVTRLQVMKVDTIGSLSILDSRHDRLHVGNIFVGFVDGGLRETHGKASLVYKSWKIMIAGIK